MDPETGLPVVDADKCTACGACVKACPKGIIELRKRWPKHRAVYVSCVSKDKGAVVMKACKAGCIGCGKCVKVCSFDAIKVENTEGRSGRRRETRAGEICGRRVPEE